jgi:hypothetical protein
MFRVLIELFIFQVRLQNLMFRALIELFIFQVRHQNLMFRVLMLTKKRPMMPKMVF